MVYPRQDNTKAERHATHVLLASATSTIRYNHSKVFLKVEGGKATIIRYYPAIETAGHALLNEYLDTNTGLPLERLHGDSTIPTQMI